MRKVTFKSKDNKAISHNRCSGDCMDVTTCTKLRQKSDIHPHQAMGTIVEAPVYTSVCIFTQKLYLFNQYYLFLARWWLYIS